MALRKDWPAIRAEWLWAWMGRETVKVNSLFGSRILLLAESSQPFKTWYELKNGEVIKHPTRYCLGEGIILVPRWDLLGIHYDPVADDGVETLGPDELKKRGMYRLNEKILVLIYQHVEDALHFSLETYDTELKQISTQLREIEDRALKSISLKEAQGIEISEEIGSAEILIEGLQDQIQLAERGIKAVLISKPVKDLIAGIPTSIEGLRVYLVKLHQNLNQIKIRPIVRIIKLVQYRFRGVLEALDVGEIERFQHQLELVIEKLKKAQKFLLQPKFVQQEQKIGQLMLFPN